MDKDELISARIEDKCSKALKNFSPECSCFLDTHQQSVAETQVKKLKNAEALFTGGYAEAERRIIIFTPSDYPADKEELEERFLRVLRITAKKGEKLNHRDYLGSILALGIERTVMGDILVRDEGADIIIFPEMAEFVRNELSKVGKTEITAEVLELNRLIVPKACFREIRETIASPRLDNAISAFFKISRTEAADAIKAGLVSVNHREVLKPDLKVDEGDILVMRGKGKVKVLSFEGETKKGRCRVAAEKYI